MSICGSHSHVVFFVLSLQALPKFKEAHERSVFKAAAVVSDVKRMLRLLDRKALGELRAIQKPDPEIEDILATIIIIRKLRFVNVLIFFTILAVVCFPIIAITNIFCIIYGLPFFS